MASKEGLRFGYQPTQQGRLIIDGATPNPLYAVERNERLIKWWGRDVAGPFRAKAQMWMTDQGVKVALRAGMNVEGESHEMEEDQAASELRKALAESQGYHFPIDSIMERAKKEARELEYQSGRTGWTRGFLMDFVGILAEARNISQKRRVWLEASILQRKMEIR